MFQEQDHFNIKLCQEDKTCDFFAVHFFETTITLVIKPDKDGARKKKNYRPVSLMNQDVKILKILVNSMNYENEIFLQNVKASKTKCYIL